MTKFRSNNTDYKSKTVTRGMVIVIEKVGLFSSRRTVLSIYAQNIRAAKYMKQIFTKMT